VTQKPKRAKRVRYPKHAVTFKVIEAALEVSEKVSTKMHGWLDLLHALRETLRLQREADRANGRAAKANGGQYTYLTKRDQYQHLSTLAASDTRYSAIHSQVLQDVADRIEHGTKAWLRGERGPLRAQLRKKYRSFTFTQYGFAAKIRGGRLHMSKLGEARLLNVRKLPGRVKSVRLVFKQGRWFAQFTCEVQLQHDVQTRRHSSAAVHALPDTGLDTGLARVATLADGTSFTPAKPLKKMLGMLKKAQRKMSRQFNARNKAVAQAAAKAKEQGTSAPVKAVIPYSNRLKRQIRRVAVIHTKIERVRRDQLRKVARRIEQNYRMVAVEEHGLEFMRRNRRTSRSVSDVAPGLFKQLLKHALGPERYVGTPNRREGIGGNSQTCLCGTKVPKTLQERWHTCPACGLSADRDKVSANIAMQIAFGYCTIKETVPGQGVVRRGESECATGKPAAPQHAAELSVKRPSFYGQGPLRNTAGAQATAEANNPLGLQGARAPCLPG
jgi:transposase